MSPLRPELVKFLERHGLPPTEESIGRLNEAGVAAYYKGRYEHATLYLSAASELGAALHGPEHPVTLTSMDYLAGTLQACGNHASGDKLELLVLEARTRVLGPEHPDTLASMGNHAETLRARDDLAGAEGLHRRVLEVMTRVLGPEHPSTLTSMNNLALTLYARGDLAGAEDLQRRELERCTRVLGPQHADTLMSMINLALTLYGRGDLAGAEGLECQVLEVRTRVLGAEHPDTLTSMGNLAETLRARGDLAGAEDLERRVLEARTRVLGAEHPDTLTSMNNLALTLYARGDLAGAENSQRQVLEVRTRVLGPEHPDTLTSMNNLALTLYARGDLAGAENSQRQVLEVRTRVLGPEHPDTLTSMNNLALTLYALGDLAGAEDLQLRDLERCTRVLGPEHPDTLACTGNLALTLKARGDLAGAEDLERRVLEARTRVLGAEHPSTLTSMNNLALTLYARGDLAGAENSQRQALEVRTRVLGPEHPDTLTSMNNQAGTYMARGDLAGAEELLSAALTIAEKHRASVGGHVDRGRMAEAMGLPVLGTALASVRIGLGRSAGEVLDALERTAGRSVLDLVTAGKPLERLAREAFGDQPERMRAFEEDTRAFLGAREAAGAAERRLIALIDARASDGVLAEARAALRTTGSERDRWAAKIREWELNLIPDAKPESLESIRATLHADEVLISYGWSHIAAVAVVVSTSSEPLTMELATVHRRRAVAGALLTALAAGVDPNPAEARAVLQAARTITEEYGFDRLDFTLAVESFAERLLEVASRRDRGERPNAVPSMRVSTLRELARLAGEFVMPPAIRERLNGASRISIAASGPLLAVPITLLIEYGEIEEALNKPVILVPTASVMARMRTHNVDRSTAAREAWEIALAGDPHFGKDEDPSQERSVVGSRDAWMSRVRQTRDRPSRLPRSRSEVVDIARACREVSPTAAPAVLIGAEATLTNVERASTGKRGVHWATHGSMGTATNPSRAGLIFAEEGGIPGELMLDAILREWEDRLRGCELVTLSACNSGRNIGMDGVALALPTGLLFAGVQIVLASCYRVSDLSTWLLMRRFYESLFGTHEEVRSIWRREYKSRETMPVSAALAEARRYVRELPVEELNAIVDKHPLPDDLTEAERRLALDEEKRLGTQAGRPFEHPSYWAAFEIFTVRFEG